MSSRPAIGSDNSAREAPKSSPMRLRVCLAASGGGHVRQLLDLRPAWEAHDTFVVTEDMPLGRSLASTNRTYFVDHYAMGQARLGRLGTMIRSALRNMWQSARIIAKEAPDVILTSGAGAVFFTVFFGRLRGAKVFLIESFARFDRPSKFARIAAPLAHHRIVQSKTLANAFSNVRVFDPLKLLEKPRPPKKPLVLVTVGATLPFDRLVKMVADAKADGLIPEQVIAQVGVDGSITPQFDQVVESMDFADMQHTLGIADLVVCHGGTGSLITALREGCRVIAVPRRADLGEHYDDHQAEITSAFERRGLITVAHNSGDFADALRRARKRDPISATTEPAELIGYLADALRSISLKRT